LTAKIDGFFARVEDRHGADMQCRTGCSDCCHTRLSITRVEADAIRALGRRVTINPDASLCAALDQHGRCQIYEARPVVCRSHGVPIRMREGSLPVIRSCHRNFTQTQADPDCVLDQETLSALVLAVNGGDQTRIDLATLLGEVE
jgi:Fe-S-cluster containining protein